VAVVIVVLGVATVVLVFVSLSYNRFVSQRQLVHNSWSNVETELRRRYDLIPNLVETVKGYAAHERETLEAVIQARATAVASGGNAGEQARDENALVGALKQLFAVTEGYPDLKASAHFLDLQRQLITTEDRIQAARRFYNANVRDLNRRVDSVPSNAVARAFGVTRAAYFEVEPAIRDASAPEVRLDQE